MGKTRTLHFTIGEDFGNMITNIARERLVEEKDVDWSIRVLTDSLIGLSDKAAFEIILGQKKIVTRVKTQDNSIEDGDGMCSYLDYNTKNVANKLKKINKASQELFKIIRNTIITVKYKTIYIPADILVPRFLNSEKNGDLDDFLKGQYSDLFDILVGVVNFLDRSIKYIAWLKKLQATSKKFDLIVTDELVNVVIELPQYLINLHAKIKELEGGNTMSFEEEEKEILEDLNKYMDGAKEINKYKTVPDEEGDITDTIKVLDDTDGKIIIQPADPKVKWDAGYIAQDGTYYALNGHIANMLHLNLADALVGAGIIPADFGGEATADSWLERQGWVKQHGDHILYGGYDNFFLGGKDVPISKAQLDTIVIIIRHHHNGIIWPGYDPANRMSVINWAASDPLQFKLKWFKI